MPYYSVIHELIIVTYTHHQILWGEYIRNGAVGKPIKYIVETVNVYKIWVAKLKKRRPVGRMVALENEC
jgi:hypothetical protein